MWNYCWQWLVFCPRGPEKQAQPVSNSKKCVKLHVNGSGWGNKLPTRAFPCCCRFWGKVAFSPPPGYSEPENFADTLRKHTTALSARLIFPKGCPVSCLETFNLSCCDGFLISELVLFSFSPISWPSLLVHLSSHSVKCSFRWLAFCLGQSKGEFYVCFVSWVQVSGDNF